MASNAFVQVTDEAHPTQPLDLRHFQKEKT
jgi:hypothetical protein